MDQNKKIRILNEIHVPFTATTTIHRARNFQNYKARF